MTNNGDVVVAVILGITVDALIDLISVSLLKHFDSERKPAFCILRCLGW